MARDSGLWRHALDDIHEALTPSVIRTLMASVQERADRALIAIAVSGGADSFAALDMVRHHLPAGQPVCLTVDHGLRATSAAEAEVVARWCHAAGIRHETLIWAPDEKPATGLQAAARAARYRLLAEACIRHNARYLVTAHHADDQAETLLMRLARGTGVEGLAAMAPAARIAAGPSEPVTLLRPFLPIRGTALKAYAGAQNLPVQEDPGNQNLDYERVAIRQMRRHHETQAGASARVPSSAAPSLPPPLMAAPPLAALSTAPPSTAALCLTAARQLAARHDLESQIFDDFTGCRGFIAATGAARLDHEALKALPASRQRRLMRRLCRAVSGNPHPPADAPVAQAVTQAVTQAIARPGAKSKVSLGGVLLWQDKGATGGGKSPHPKSRPALWVLREPAAVLGRAGVPPAGGVRLEPGSLVLWDNRFIIEPGPETMTIRPLGQIFAGGGIDAAGSAPADGAIQPVSSIAGLGACLLATLPAGFVDGRCCCIPIAAKNSVIFGAGPWRSSLDTLHVKALTDERFFRPVIRF